MIQSKNGIHAILCDSCGKVIDSATGDADLYFRNRANYHTYSNIDGKLIINADGDICSDCRSKVIKDFRKAFKSVCDEHRISFSIEYN